MGIDLDQIIAEEEERDPFPFTFDGVEYTLPAAMDIRAVAAIAGGRLDDGLRLLLNPEQWDAIQASPKVLTGNALRKLFEAYTAYTDGESVGKSSASTGSSKNTGTRSRRTSSVTTKPGSDRLVTRLPGGDSES